MKIINYFLQYLLIKLFFLICKIIGYKKASNLGKLVGEKVGPYLKSKKVIKNNINRILPNATKEDVNLIVKKMWGNYGRILSEYVFIKDFKEGNLEKYVNVIGSEYLNDIRKKNIPVVFVSGHFNNFELMAMVIQKEGVNLGAIYRPLNNFFLNKTMEKIRIKYICKIQIKKGLSGIREILNLFKKNVSIALMIDQRVTEGIKSNFFNREAFTTTIPAQLVKKFNCPVVSIYIERIEKYNFRLIINKPIYFAKDESLEQITEKLNYILEKMVLKNPEQWILTHNRWKL
jgi:KDO2-lipid IV(A) lauroyltransferase